ELCIADDGSTRPETLAVLRQIGDPRCKIQFLERNRGIAAASNAALALAQGEYVAFLDHDDELTSDALYRVVKAVHQHDPDLIYSDEDKLSPQGYRLEPHFKPDYSPDLLLSINYICHLSVYRKSLLAKTGAFREGFEGAQDHDLVLRALDQAERIHHIPKILYHWRMIPGSTAARFDSKHHAWEAGRRAVEDTLRRRGIAGEALPGQYPGSYRVKRAIRERPLISILMPFRDHPDLLRHCLDSILEKSTYANFELLGISNNSLEPETFAAMDHYSAKDSRVRFVRHDVPFNYAAINNFASRQAKGAQLLLLNNDMTIITPDWLEALLEHSQRPEVGAVGAKLYYPDDTVQHGGVIVGVGGIAGHAHKYTPRDDPGYFSRLHLIQNLSAVTAACLMVKKALYDQIGGMDERHLTVAFNDVDFCLRLREKGYLNVFTPYCELYHHESKTRGYEDTPRKKQRFAKEIAYMRKRHAAILRDGDPYYNLNLPLDREDFGML
ncbi:MAG: glycosyltransferase family 2 protein, partial [Candidatus Competibacter sp.]|nr:glycosyltransferase family 2 protein [Candidatus Competibacter sp.]